MDRRNQPSEQLEKIRSDMTGGLNLTASSQKIPLTDTPLQRNIKINVGGRVRTRFGTRIVYTSSVNIIDVFSFSFATFNFLILKVGRDLIIGTISPTNTFSTTQTFPNVWGVAAGAIAVQSTLVNDGTSRLIITSGVEVAKEIRFVPAGPNFTVNDYAATGQPSQWTGTNWPRSVAVWDGRLWFGGTPGQPNVIWSSKAGDFTNLTPGVTAADGFVVSLQSSEDTTIQKLESFRSALISFGRRAILAIQPATFVSGSSVSGGVVTPTNFRVVTISTNGCVSGRTVLRVDKTLHYLSDTGVYELTETSDSTQPYIPTIISQKLVELFENTPGSLLVNSCSGYSTIDGEYWVTLPETNVKRTDTGSDLKSIYVYKLLNKEWTVYDYDSLRSRSSIKSIREFLDTSGNPKMVTSMFIDGLSYVILHGEALRSDFLTSFAPDGTNKTFTFPIPNALRPTQTFPLNSAQAGPLTTSFEFDLSSQVPDLQLLVDGVSKPFLKKSNTSIQALGSFPGVPVVSFTSPQARVYINGIVQTESQYAVVGDNVLFVTAPPNGSSLHIGLDFMSERVTFEIQADDLRDLKKFKYLYLYQNLPEEQGNIGSMDLEYWIDGNRQRGVFIPKVYNHPELTWGDALWNETYPTSRENTRAKLPVRGLFHFMKLRFRNKGPGIIDLTSWEIKAKVLGQKGK